ncbi:MAG: hypothetical protein LBN24_02425 [Mediterranea sp.]|jgi:hypothetical protein|nr:hypothetical protein [Mediterranea sp.]
MKQLNFTQMETINGGGWTALSCVGAILGMVALTASYATATTITMGAALAFAPLYGGAGVGVGMSCAGALKR